ncbi:hypothetical protein LX36DRAFT_651105 [Colletotrichum falcatum]|nr:hypothetical protein LX36DRAFT_651105 [Colletotrichum falcatum]
MPKPMQEKSAARTHVTEQLPVSKTVYADCEIDIVDKATKHAGSDSKNGLGSGKTIASEGALPHDAVAVTVTDVRVSLQTPRSL